MSTRSEIPLLCVMFLPTYRWPSCFVLFSSVLFVAIAQAQIPVGLLPGTSLGFETRPLATEWSTLSIPGIDNTFGATAMLESAVQTNSAFSITNRLSDFSPTNPPLQAGLASWTSGGGSYVQTRPTGNGATLLMATLRNSSGTNANGLSITYTLTAGGSTLTEQVPSHQTFYSFSGLAGSWMAIPALSGGGSGVRNNTIAFASPWPGNAMLYLLWADDNATSGTDNSWEIDDITFIAQGAAVPLAVTVTTPANGTPMLPPTNVTVSVSTSGTVPPTRVSIYRDNVLVTSLTSPPYVAQFSVLSPATNSIYAIATNLSARAVSVTNVINVRDEFVHYFGGINRESFDSMGTTGMETPLGWYVGSNLPATTMNLTVGDGSQPPIVAVDGWNLGSFFAPSNRSLGTGATVTNRETVVCIQNNTSLSIREFEFRYDGEVWRAHTTGTESLTNYVSFDQGTTWRATGYNFLSPVGPASPAGALDGHDGLNRVAGLGGMVVASNSVAPGGFIYLRWHNFNELNTDGVLAIDNFSFRGTVFGPGSNQPPFSATLSARSVTRTNALLSAMATPNDAPAMAWFEWGISAAYGSVTGLRSLPAGNNVVYMQALLSGLQPLQPYHFRLIVSNETGVAYGPERTFITGGNVALWGGTSIYQQTNAPVGLTDTVAVDSSAYHSVILGANKRVAAWSFNNYGQSVAPPLLGPVAAVAAGFYHSLALLDDGTVRAWGEVSPAVTNPPPNLSSVVQIDAGFRINVALKESGEVVAWGESQTNLPAGLSNIVSVAIGAFHGLALRHDGKVVAWGSAVRGETNIPINLSNVVMIAAGGYTSMGLRSDGTIVSWGAISNTPPGATGVVAIAAGDSHCFALQGDGTLLGWGSDDVGQLTRMPFGRGDVIGFAAGAEHSIALIGSNVAPRVESKTFFGVAGEDLTIALPATDYYGRVKSFRILSIPSQGMLYNRGFGGGRLGSIGVNSVVDDAAGRVIFAPGGTGAPYATFTCQATVGATSAPPALVTINILPRGNAFAHTHAAMRIRAREATLNGMATPNGTPSAAWFDWGLSKSYGNQTAPVAIGGGSDVIHVKQLIEGLVPEELYYFRLVVSNASGLSLGPEKRFTTGGGIISAGLNLAFETVPPRFLTNAVTLDTSGYANISYTSDGTNIVYWGDCFGMTPASNSLQVALSYGGPSVVLNSDGTVRQLFFPYCDSPPISVAHLSNIVSVVAGGGHDLFLRSDGKVFAAGVNDFSQINVPVELSNVVAIAAGQNHSLAVSHDGYVTAWGRNDFGQTNVPIGLSNVVAVAGGTSHSMALCRDGTVVAWGKNNSGQTNVPAGLSNVVAIAAGSIFCLALRSDWIFDGLVVGWGDNQFGQAASMRFLKPAAIAAGSAHRSVLVAPTLGSDNRREAPLILADAQPLQLFGRNHGATRELNEPVLSSIASSSNSVWYEWFPFGARPEIGALVASVDTYGVDPRYFTGSALKTPILAAGFTDGYFADEANSSSFYKARLVSYANSFSDTLLAVDGSAVFGGLSQDNFILSLTFVPRPSNDLFAGRSLISGTLFETNGSFVGGFRENEPAHGPGNFPQTLWWTWTAPTNLGIPTQRVRLTADSVSLPPDIGVYQGDSVDALTAVPATSVVSGMTKTVDFTAASGATYQIALAGRQHDPAGNIVDVRYGRYRFRFASRVVTLDCPTNFISVISTTLTPIPCGDSVRAFSAQARITNSGNAPLGPLRVLVQASSGASAQGPYSGSTCDRQGVCDLGVFPIAASNIVQNYVVPFTISGAIPRNCDPPLDSFGAGYGVGWGVYASVQEQVGTQWFTLDQMLIAFGDWPSLGSNPGPGGGVIRLDPGYVGLTAFNPLRTVNVLGSLLVPEGSSVNYTGKAVYADSTAFNFTNTAWTASRFTITTNGVFTAGSVTSNTAVLLDASYSSGGLLYHAVTNVVVSNLPPPALSWLRKLNATNFAFSVSGVPGRSNRVEATTNLTPPTVWSPLMTNAPTSGVFQFTNQIPTNVPKRFFRVQEL